MGIEFCPLETAWGNWADWAAVAVAALGALAVFLLSRAANRTADASFKLSLGVQKKVDELQQREQQLLARELLTDLNVAWSNAQWIVRALANPEVEWHGDRGLAKKIGDLEFHAADRVRDRLHVLTEPAASDVAEAQLRIRQFKANAHDFTTRFNGTFQDNVFIRVLTGSARLTEDALSAAFNSLREVNSPSKSP